jgi:hypothetical protein
LYRPCRLPCPVLLPLILDGPHVIVRHFDRGKWRG